MQEDGEDGHNSIIRYQDLWKDAHVSHAFVSHEPDEGDSATYNDIFFQLANAPLVSYRVPDITAASHNTDGTTTTIGTHDKTKRQETQEILIRQDIKGTAQKHTGGIVWETAYLLLDYLLCELSGEFAHNAANSSTSSTDRPQQPEPQYVFSFLNQNRNRRGGTILELGSGCGMLGLVLHKALSMAMCDSPTLTWKVILSETQEVMENLRGNVLRNYPVALVGDHDVSLSSSLRVCELDWLHYQDHCSKSNIPRHSVDLLLGTDVVFSTRFVEPLLRTMDYLAHDNTIVVLCLQERCPDSHALLLDKAQTYGFVISDISSHVFETFPLCRYGLDLECKLLHFSRTPTKQQGKSKTTRKRSLIEMSP